MVRGWGHQTRPHIADDDEFEVVGRVFEPLRQDLIFLVGVMFDCLIRSAAVMTLILPLLRSSLCQSGAEFDDRVVELQPP